MSNHLKSFFLMCSGANQTILAQDDCQIERGKYIAIGLTVLFTAMLAMLSGTYALFTVFGNIPAALLFGLFWGCLIFNLDRYIVSSLRKKYVDPESDFKTRWRAKLNELLRAAPRFFLALFISLIITKPIELHLFEREINAKLDRIESDQMVGIIDDVKREYGDVSRLESEIKAMKAEVAEKEQRANQLYQLAMDEAVGTKGKNTTGRRGKGIVFQERMADYERAYKIWQEVKQRNEEQIAAREKQIADLRIKQGDRVKGFQDNLDRSRGLLAQLDALGMLGRERETIWWANLFLILLFIMLETSPIIVKLFSDRGPYDDIYEAKEHEVFATQQKKISDLIDRINCEVAISRQINADRVRTELELHRRTLDSIHTIAFDEIREAQQELLRSFIDDWREIAMSQIHNERRRAARNNGTPANEAPPDTPPEPAATTAAAPEPPRTERRFDAGNQ